jgi:aminomethyltransferase
MPIQYKDSIMEATTHCREKASIFDVSHMCGLTLKGKDAVSFLEKLVVGDIKAIENGSGSLSVFTNEKGGIIDDTVVTKVADDEIYLVVNAGCREKDLAHIKKHLDKFTGDGGKTELEVHDDRSLLALQGPLGAEVLQKHVDIDLSKLYFSNFVRTDIAGIPCFLTRTGYTGEDGFEISAPDAKALELTKKLLEDERVRMCGLGPRDSLRLEAGLCLYGNDLNEDITPIEAGLKWTIGKSRRDKCDFLGGEVIKKQMEEGVDSRRVGFISSGAPARQHSKIVTPDGEEVGEITSGAFSPCLKKNIAMGYVKKPHDKAGTKLKVVVRGKQNDAEVTKMPFVKTTYYRPS